MKTTRTKRDWTAVVAEFETSGMSAYRYSREHGVCYKTLLGKLKLANDEGSGAFVEIPLHRNNHAGIEIDFGNGIRVRMDTPLEEKMLASLFEALRRL
jgi:hypothetical protein